MNMFLSEDTVGHMLIKFLVQKQIFCPITGKVLDVRTCAVVLDADNDPVRVYDPSVKEQFEAKGATLAPGNSWLDRS